MILILLQVTLLVILVLALLAPLESLAWWARHHPSPALPAPEASPVAGIRRFAVYLSGIAVIDGASISRREHATLEEVRRRLSDVVITEDVFPYAMENRGLAQRATAWLWHRLDRARRRIRWWPVPLLINLRNVMQVLVSADPRYGGTYNFGVACVVWQSLLNAGYDPANPAPVTLIGYSGGAQIACGVARFLSAHDIQVDIVSIGGVFADDPGLDHIRSLTHLKGNRDHVQRLGTLAFPGRWSTAPLSSYGRAVRDGRIHTIDMGPIHHRGYFSRHILLPNDRTAQEETVRQLVEALRR
jgi:protease of the abi (CAAX) family-like protein